MPTCATCAYWQDPAKTDHYAAGICAPRDPDTFEPMDRGFKVKTCTMPTQTFGETPVERNGFGLVDGSQHYAMLVTAEDFGCVRHQQASEAQPG